MSSDARALPSGYRQPPQARLFGSGGLAIVLLVAALLFSVQLIRPAPVAIDVGKVATFVVKSVPLDRPVERPDPPASPVPVAPVPPVPAAIATPTVIAPAVEMSAPPLPVVPPTSASTTAATPPPAAVAQPSALPTTRQAPATASVATAADWRSRLLGHLKRYRRYPRQAETARQQGTARIAITLRRTGEVSAVELVRGSGYPLLDLEARATAQRASPLPAPDASIGGDPVTVEVPIEFALTR